MRSIAITTQKGGVAKTTSAANLACALAERDRRVLLVDLDPQAALTRLFGLVPGDLEVSVGEVLEGFASINDAIIHVGAGVALNKVDLIGARPELKGTERNLVNAIGREQKLRLALEQLPPFTYDYILLDTPPHLGDLTLNALIAANEAIIPVKMTDKNALEGAAQVLRTIAELGPLGYSVDVLPFLQTFSKPRRVAQRATYEALETLGPVSPNAIPALAEAEDAMYFDEPTFVYKTDGQISEAYRRYAAELMEGESPDFIAASAAAQKVTV